MIDKKIIFMGVLVLLVLTGCGKDKESECEVCEDCEPHIQTKTLMIEENVKLRNDVDSLKEEITELKEQNETLTNNTQIINLIQTNKELEEDLEECWLEEDNNEYRDLYRDCRDERDDLEDDLEQCENETDECMDDLEECEDD